MIDRIEYGWTGFGNEDQRDVDNEAEPMTKAARPPSDGGTVPRRSANEGRLKSGEQYRPGRRALRRPLILMRSSLWLDGRERSGPEGALSVSSRTRTRLPTTTGIQAASHTCCFLSQGTSLAEGRRVLVICTGTSTTDTRSSIAEHAQEARRVCVRRGRRAGVRAGKGKRGDGGSPDDGLLADGEEPAEEKQTDAACAPAGGDVSQKEGADAPRGRLTGCNRRGRWCGWNQ